MLKLPRFSESAFTVVAIFFFSRGFFGFFVDADDLENPSSSTLSTIAFTIYIVTFLLLIFRWEETCKSIFNHKWILVLLLLSIVSMLWSSVPDIAFRKSVTLIGTTLFGIYLGTHYSFEHQIKLTGWAFGISALLSFLVVFLLPSYGVMHTDALEGAWQGIYLHKSTLGENMLISFLTFYFLFELKSKYRLIGIIFCFLSTILIVFSKSAGSIVTLILILILFNIFKHLSLRSKLGVSSIFLFLTLFVLAQFYLALNLFEFLDATSKDITLTGRTPLWESLWDYIKLKIWVGYGYGSFFSATHTETQQLWKAHAWGAVHAHNGYIQILVHLGLTGLLIFISGYFYNLIKSLILYFVSKNIQALMIFFFLLYTVVFNTTEVSFLSANHLNWVLSVSYIYSMSKIHTSFPAQRCKGINLEHYNY